MVHWNKNIIIIITFVSQSDGLPALVTLKKGLVALARQWMKFIVVTPAFKGVRLLRPAQPLKPQNSVKKEEEDLNGLENGAALQSDTSADGAEFEFDAGMLVLYTVLNIIHCFWDNELLNNKVKFQKGLYTLQLPDARFTGA